MDASKLEAQPPGDIVIEIVQVWEKKENVTGARFSEVSRAIQWSLVTFHKKLLTMSLGTH